MEVAAQVVAVLACSAKALTDPVGRDRLSVLRALKAAVVDLAAAPASAAREIHITILITAETAVFMAVAAAVLPPRRLVFWGLAVEVPFALFGLAAPE